MTVESHVQLEASSAAAALKTCEGKSRRVRATVNVVRQEGQQRNKEDGLLKERTRERVRAETPWAEPVDQRRKEWTTEWS